MNAPPALLGIDLGTTHCKVGMFDEAGTLLHLATRSTPVSRTEEGLPFHDPAALWSVTASGVREVLKAEPRPTVQVVGVTSMAEAGLLVDAVSGEPRTHVIPWYDRRAQLEVEELARIEEPRTLFGRSGLHPSFKFALPKLLWLSRHQPDVLDGSVWLSVADYIVFRLTGSMATDPTLAARTYAYSLTEEDWDHVWIRAIGFDPAIFPVIRPSGGPAGAVWDRAAKETGLRTGTPVSVCGHDHVCSMLAAGVLDPGPVLDSIGTAESMLGVLPALHLGDEAFDSGLAFVPHVLPGRYCWLGGLSAAGGSIEWVREQLGEPRLSYDEIVRLALEAGPAPTGILYFPYLSGSGAPLPDGSVRGALIGLDARHRRPDLVKAVLEGTAYAAESIRQVAEHLTGEPIREVVALGGGARNGPWMQIKADVSGCTYSVAPVREAAALGAALVAALGAGVFEGVDTVRTVVEHATRDGRRYLPDAQRHAVYSRLYISGFVHFQGPLRQIGRAMEFDGIDG